MELVQARAGDGMRWRTGCHPRRSCWIRDHFLMPHPPAWLCLMLLLPSICNFSNRLDGTNYSRKALMQRWPHGNSATGHPSGINHRRGIAGGRRCLACSLRSAPWPPVRGDTTGHRRALPGDRQGFGGAWGSLRCLLSTPGCRGQLPAQGQSGPLRPFALLPMRGVTAGCPGGHRRTPSLGSAGHLGWGAGSPQHPALHPLGQRGEGDEPRGGFGQRHDPAELPAASQHLQSYVSLRSSGPSSLPGQESSLSPCLSPLVTHPLAPPASSRPRWAIPI